MLRILLLRWRDDMDRKPYFHDIIDVDFSIIDTGVLKLDLLQEKDGCRIPVDILHAEFDFSLLHNRLLIWSHEPHCTGELS